MRILYYDCNNKNKEITTIEVRSVSYYSDLMVKPAAEGLLIRPFESEVYKEMFIRNVCYAKACEICEQLLEKGFADLRDVGIVEYYDNLSPLP